MVDQIEKTTCVTKQCHFLKLFEKEHIRVGENSTTVKVQTITLETQKIHFIRQGFTENARKIEEQGAHDALVQLLFDEISQGFVVITTKRADGKLHVMATKEIAQQLNNGSLTLQSKKGKIKEIAEVEVVLPEVFQALALKLITAQDKKETKTENLEESQKTAPAMQNHVLDETYSPEFFERLHIAIFSTWAMFCPTARNTLELRTFEEMCHIQERLRQKQEKLREEEAARLRVDVLKYEVRKFEIQRSENRQQAIKT